MSQKDKEFDGVRDGFKKTRVGTIPSDWMVGPIREFNCEFIAGGTPSRENEDYFEGNIPWLKTSEVQNSRISSCGEFLTEEGLKNSSAKVVPSGSVLVAMYGGGTVGNIGLLETEASTNQACCAIQTDESILSNEYLYYHLLFEHRRLVSYASGSSQQNLNKSDVESFNIAVPPLPEQNHITNVLSTVDKIIQKTDEIIEKAKKIQRGLMQDLVISGIGHEEYQSVQLGPREVELPVDWIVETLGENAEIVSGSTPKKKNESYWGGEIVWITPTDITENNKKYINNSKEQITQQGLESCSAKILEPGAVLMTSRATIGEVAINTVPVTTNQGFKSFVCGDNLHNEYLFYYIQVISDYLNAIAGGSTFSEINKSDTSNVRVPLPPIEEQKNIADIISQSEMKVLKEKKQRQYLQELKRGLMQDLLTGKVRVNPEKAET